MRQFNVTGMSCAACSSRVEKAVSKLDGVTSCSVSLLTNSMGVEGNVSDDTETIGNNTEFVSITKMTIDIHLLGVR